MAKYLESFLNWGIDPRQADREKVSARFFMSFVIPGGLLLLSFIIRSFLRGNVIPTYFYISIAAACLLNTIYLIRSKNIFVAANLGTFLATLTVLFLFITTGPFHEGHIWLVVLPTIVFILNGTKRGLTWTLSIMGVIAVIVILGDLHFYSFPYTFETFWATALAALAATVCMFFFENILHTNEVDIEKFKLAVDSAFNHIIITDPDAHILYANAAATKITGYTFKEMLGQTPALWGNRMPKEFYVKFWDIIKNKKEPFTGRIDNKRKSGQIYHAEISVSPILDRTGKVKYFVGIERDITKEVEAAIANERLAAIVRDTDEAIFSKDLKGVVTSWNRGAEEMYGYTAKEAIGKNIKDLTIPKDKYKEVDEILAKIAKGERVVNLDTKRQRKDGTIFEANITFSPVRDEKGKIIAASISARDITKQKEIDRMKTEFVSLASHQLRTPLTSIKWYLEMILEGTTGKLSKELKDYLTDVYDSNETMIKLVNSLLNISRIESGRLTIEPKPTDLLSLVNSTLTKVNPEAIKANVKISISAAKDLPKINIDPNLISNVYLNLIANSIKYTPEKGQVVIAMGKEGDSIVSSVKDNGVGIPKDEQKRIFERFFRGSNVSSTAGGSTGLGLYLAKQIVEASGGKIWFESKEGVGSTFYFSLPLAGSPAQKGEVSLS